MSAVTKHIVYDEELQLEAYSFHGITQSFPNHFHEHYSIGYVKKGTRRFICQEEESLIAPGDLLLLNPEDTHQCISRDDSPLYFLGLNISTSRMLHFTEEITGIRRLPKFSVPVIKDSAKISDITAYFLSLHKLIMKKSRDFRKEELLLLLVFRFISDYSRTPSVPLSKDLNKYQSAVELACSYMDDHFSEPIRLEQLCLHTGLSKSTLLRSFTKIKGVTPYRYLENYRINRAKELLQDGVLPADAAQLTGFCDQSHFSNYFNQFTGLSPGAYREIFLGKTSTT